MLIEVEKDLKYLDIFATGRELTQVMGFDETDEVSEQVFVHRFENPLLMTDGYKISRLNPTLRETLTTLYSYKPRVVRYDGVETFWDETHINVWCPSIDTVFLAKSIGTILNSATAGNFKIALEIGTGSGFLSKYILAKSKNLTELTINDISIYAIKSATDNIKDPRAQFYLGDGLKLLNNHKFDLIVTNPPYIPRPWKNKYNPYEGTGIVRELLQNGHKYISENGIILMNISSLCCNDDLLSRTNLKVELLDTLRVPLKVNNVLNNKEWIDYLEKNGLEKQQREDYEYWHELRVFKFSLK